MVRSLSISLFLTATTCFSQSPDSTEFTELFGVQPVNIGSLNSAFGAVSTKSSMYFVAEKNVSPFIVKQPGDSSVRFYELYVAAKKDDINLASASVLPAAKNFLTVGAPAVMENDSLIVFSAAGPGFNYLKGEAAGSGLFRLYSCFKENGKWSKPKEITSIPAGISCFTPALALNGSKLYYSAKASDGMGGYDIYYCERAGAGWSAPVNAGDKINSAANESFPGAGKNGQLFFASDRKGGAGGLDLYSSHDGGTQAMRLSAPFNSESDDFSLQFSNDSLTAYFSSSREGTDKIYFASRLVPAFDSLNVPRRRFCYTFFEEQTAQNLDTTGLSYEWDFGNEKLKGLEVKHCFPKPGTYPVNLNIIDSNSGEIFSNEVSYDFVVDTPKQLEIAGPDTVILNSYTIYDAGSSMLPGKTIREYYWVFDDTVFNTGTLVRHKYFNTGVHTVKLGVVAVNDSTGKPETWYAIRKIWVVTPLSPATGSVQETGNQLYLVSEEKNLHQKQRK